MRTSALSLLAAVLTLVAHAKAANEADGRPPASSFDYAQYGVAFVAETIATGGNVCPAGAATPCILGSGGGLAVRVGYRARGRWYVGGAYEASRHDSSNLLRLAILQQLRAEARYYLDQGSRVTPYGAFGVGGALYGSEWGADTGGFAASVGGGFELQLSRTTVVGAALGYRPLVFRAWTDSTGQRRADEYFGFGMAHAAFLELILEVREPLPRW
ncbi:MAG: hypothetical protein R3B13_24450 [Polyangiaceae bacterium]